MNENENENGPASEMLSILHIMHGIVLDDEAWNAVAPRIFEPGSPLEEIRQALHTAVDKQGLMLQMTQQIMRGLSMGIQPPDPYQMPARKPQPGEDEGPDLLFG